MSLAELLASGQVVDVTGAVVPPCDACDGIAVIRCSGCGFKACVEALRESPCACPVCDLSWWGEGGSDG